MSAEVASEVIVKTQKALGKYIKKPQLTEKLLKKPPFRFLHDIIKAVIKETGFFKGLFTEAELNSDNVKEKEAKIAFLNKLIDATKAVTKTELNVKASKIVAGLEPTETNILLQTIAKAIDKKIDSSEYVKQQTGSSPDKKTRKPSKERRENAKESKPKRTPSNETPVSTDRTKSNASKEKETKTKVKREDSKVRKTSKDDSKKHKDEKGKEQETKEEVEVPLKNDEVISPKTQKLIRRDTVDLDPVIDKEKENLVKTDAVEDKKEEEKEMSPRARVPSAALVRPKSARPKSAEKDKVMIEKQDVLERELVSKPIQTRPKSSLRPPSVRPSSARPGAPRLRPDSALPIQEPVTMGNINVIVENVDNNEDEEETVVIQPNLDEVEHESPVLAELEDQENKGHLVEQILEQLQEKEKEGMQKKVEIDWDEGLRGKNAANKEISQLRNAIQNLSKTANPLGKLLNYLHEDFEAMQNELQMWINTKKQLYSEIEKQRKISTELNKPLLSQLEQIQQEIKKQEQEILNVRSNILKNDNRIKELLSK